MLISFHSHHAPITPRTPSTRLRAERIIAQLVRRIPRPVDVTVRVEPGRTSNGRGT